MKQSIQHTLSKGLLLLSGACLSAGCTDSFLEPDPLSFYEPEKTFTSESGLQAALAMCDRHLRLYWTDFETNNINVPISTEYLFSDLALYGKTDAGSWGCYDNFADKLTPTNGISNGDDNQISYFWEQSYNGIKYANTVLAYLDNIQGLDETTRHAYMGRAYFHRSYRYLNLVFQFGNVPLVTKLLEIPKQNYRTTKKEAILQMITQDMEKAVQWVPEQADTKYYGMVNKGACRQLLIKCYLATGQWAKAEAQADTLIRQYPLMTNSFGSFANSGEPDTWHITRNVIWDLHRPENKALASNTETIMMMPNNSNESHTDFLTMRIFVPFWNDKNLKMPDGNQAMINYARNNKSYNQQYDWTRALGRGIATIRLTHFAQHGLWKVNGVEDRADLRHNSEVGNWVNMEDLKYYNTASRLYNGRNVMLYSDTTIAARDAQGNLLYNADGTPKYTVKQGDLLCNDTIRDWFDFPLYKVYLKDESAEQNMGANQFNGATKGSNANWYLYRSAETYLLRAEARLYQGNVAGATEDVNTVRHRAQCSQYYTKVNIGDIMNERARELYLEEWRHTELVRVSYCLALSGIADEWGNTYNLSNWDKQSCTDDKGGSYWYQRVIHYSYYNRGYTISSGQATALNYRMDKHNLYWPIPNGSIVGNNKGELAQNYGYDGYDANAPMWTSWQEAVADENSTK